MPRKGPAPRRDLTPDPVYRSLLVTQLVNKILLSGKKSVAERTVYNALEIISERTANDPVITLKRAVENARPLLEVFVFDFDESIYGRRIEVEFVHKLRDEERYSDLDALTRQIHADVAQARDYFATHSRESSAI